MNIRKTILVALIIMGCITFLSTTLAINLLFIGNVQKLETENADTMLTGVNKNLKQQSDSLLLNDADWSSWDSTYNFTNGEKPDYIGNDFQNVSLKNVGINLFLVLDKNGETYFTASDAKQEWINAAANQIVASGEFRPDSESWNKTGYVMISGVPTLLVANPILKSDGTGPIAGTLIFGRIMSDESLSNMSPAPESDLKLSLEPYKGEGSDSEPNVIVLSNSQLLGTMPLTSSLASFPQIQITALFKRTIYLETSQASNLFLIFLAITQITAIGTCIWMVDTRLIRRLNDLNLQISNLDVKKALRPVIYNRSNEISPIIKKINILLIEIENYKMKLSESERLTAIGQTASMVGHDLRNPLQTITLANYLIRRKLSEESERISLNNFLVIKNQLDTLDKQTTYMDKIVGDIQAYSNASKPNLERVDILKLASDTLATIQIPDNVHVSVESNPDLPDVEVDVFMLRRVFSNLITNAVQAMPAGGSVRVYAGKLEDGVVVSIQDTGPGISELAIGNIFRPFYTTKAKGTGLGLSVSKRIVEAHGGRIDVESTVGVGSRFYFVLPLSVGVPRQVVAQSLQ